MSFGAYYVLLFRFHVALVGAAVDGGNLFVENILEAVACSASGAKVDILVTLQRMRCQSAAKS